MNTEMKEKENKKVLSVVDLETEIELTTTEYSNKMQEIERIDRQIKELQNKRNSVVNKVARIEGALEKLASLRNKYGNNNS